MRGGWLALPLNDYIKKKHNVNPVETTERLEKDLNFQYQDLINKGFPEKEVKQAINQNKKPDNKQENSTVDPTEEAMSALKESYQRYQTFEAEKAEIKVKELLESLNLPSLVIRSVIKLDVWSRCSQLYLRGGLSLSGLGVGGKIEKDFKKDEYDLQMVFVDGDTLNWVLVEVKNSNSYPWESTVSPPNPSLFEGNLQEVKRNPKKARKVGSWGQLTKSFTFLS